MSNRQFRGIWIPAEIWLSEELSLQEKVMLVEIDSLQDPNRGCYKSNAALAEFFQLSKSRVSEIISNLAANGWLVVDQIREGKQCVERRIFIGPRFKQAANAFDKPEGYSENSENPIRKTARTPSENSEGSNTLSNTLRGVKKPIGSSDAEPTDKTDPDFESAWSAYPKRLGSNPKTKALSAWKARRKEGVPAAAMIQGAKQYAASCNALGKTHTEFVMQAARFFGPGREWETAWPMSAPVKPQGHQPLPTSYEGSQTPDSQLGDFFG
jgi:hypothetical protein